MAALRKVWGQARSTTSGHVLLCRYVEVHMEQGPVLQATGFPLGPVAAIAGQTRLAVSVLGTQVRPGLPAPLEPTPLAFAWNKTCTLLC